MSAIYPETVANATNIFDRAAIHAHFAHLHHAAARADVPGKMVLAVYGQDPDTKEDFASVQHFEIGDVDGMTAAAMAFDGAPHRNVYAPLVILKPETPAGTRKEEDIAVVFGFDIDGDADKGKDAPTSPLPADYIIESSAGNTQYFLFLDRPLPQAEAKAFAKALKRATGAECADAIGCDRYAIGMRSPQKRGVLSAAIGMRSVCDRVCVQPPIPP